MNSGSKQCCNIDEFCSLAKECAGNFHDKKYALISIDFDNFNFINDLFGYEAGDKALEEISRQFAANIRAGEVFARIYADHFVFWLIVEPNEDLRKRLLSLTDTKSGLARAIYERYNIICSGGIVLVDEVLEDLTFIIDKANFARKRAKGNHESTFLYYDEPMSEDLRWKKIITLTMESALEDNEFEMYLQPKILLKTNQIVGAEALVRWNSKKYGMIYPNSFIPILEQNGFIDRVDFFMLEQVCKFQKELEAEGIAVAPISVNFSKTHLRNDNFVDRIFEIVHNNGVSPNLIEIELTESIFLDDFQMLLGAAGTLKHLGFKVALDDFGAAYSSLNYLKDLPFDVIKIDKAFLNAYENDRGKIVLAKMVELIKSLRMVCLMEGVEEAAQVEFLQKLSCDVGQGYFYARPMPKENYKEFVKNNSTVDQIQRDGLEDCTTRDYLNIVPKEFEMDNWELYVLGKNIDMGLMKGYIDAEVTVQYVNDRALEYLGYSRQEFRQILNNSIVAFSHPDDAQFIRDNAQQLIKTSKPLGFRTRAIRKDGKVITLQGRASCVVDNRGRHVGIYAFQDVTEELDKVEKLEAALREEISKLEEAVKKEKSARMDLRISEERYKAVVEQSSIIMFEWDFATDTINFSDKYKQIFGVEAITDRFSSNEAVRECIHPDDHCAFESWIQSTYGKSGSSTALYRIKCVNGSYIRVNAKSTSFYDDNGQPVRAIGLFEHG